jgi:hypothetical protein
MTDGGFGGGEDLQPDLCDLCGTVIADRTEYCAFVRDSSAIYRHDPAMDGRRMVVACSPGHLDQLVEKCGRRPFVEAENEKLRRQVERLEKELARNKAALEVMGKASALLEMISEGAD